MPNNPVKRLLLLEAHARTRPPSTGIPVIDRLTVDEQARLCDLNNRVAALGLDALTNDDLDDAVDLSCRLWDRHPSIHRRHEKYPWAAAKTEYLSRG